MRKAIRSVLTVLLITALGIVNLSGMAFAEELPAAEIPVVISLSGTLPEQAENFKVTLTADNGNDPMPSGSENGVCALTIAGANAAAFPILYFSEPGIYSYTICQQAGSNGDCTYDNAKYHLTVYVTNAENGGLAATSVLYGDNENNKLDGVKFSNVYKTIAPETEPETEAETEPETREETEPETEPETVPETKKETEGPKVPDKQQTNTPKTGDDSRIALYAGLLGAALFFMIGTVLFMKRNRNCGN